MTPALSIALIGDLHGQWDGEDVLFFNRSDYELLLFTGDLGSGTRKNGVDVARSVARLDKRALVVAGNNDAPYGPEIAAEFRLQSGLTELMRLAPRHPLAEQREGKVVLCGYGVHDVTLGKRDLSVVVGRPYAMGDNELSFPEALRDRYGVTSLEQSKERLCALVEQAPTEEILLLAHNGPSGLGGNPKDIWGCDFRPGAGDWGDDDLLVALQHAKRIGKRVLAVIAGHMHRSHAFTRTPTVHQDGVLFVNPAFVPRVFADKQGMVRHHMVLDVTEDSVSARDVFIH